MGKLFAFHETARGHLHVLRDIPCEDYSESYSDVEGKYFIAIVADGHGAIECFRSDVGSRLVCKATCECLKEFAETNMKDKITEERFYCDINSNMRYQTMAIRQLTNAIIARWSDNVYEYHNNNPMTEEEKEMLESKFDEDYISDILKNVLHIYGTTMMAVLHLPKCIVLIHQGDGRLNVIFDDGSIQQPVPWDERCEDTATTSMCDDDVASSIRTRIINTEDKEVVACLLGSDGIEDCYRDTYDDLGGTHSILGGTKTFYKDLVCKMASLTENEFLDYLKDFLPVFSERGKFSKSGSGDDISVAGVVDIEGIKPLIDQYLIDTQMYSLEEELFLKEDQLRGKKRKHGILENRFKEAEAEYLSKVESIKEINDIVTDLREKRDLYFQESQWYEEKLEEFQRKEESEMIFEDTEEILKSKMHEWIYLLGMTVQEMRDRIKSNKDELESNYRKAKNEVSDMEQKIRKVEEKLQLVQNEVTIAKKTFEMAKKNFEEYHEDYQQIEEECQRISEKIKGIQL